VKCKGQVTTPAPTNFLLAGTKFPCLRDTQPAPSRTAGHRLDAVCGIFTKHCRRGSLAQPLYAHPAESNHPFKSREEEIYTMVSGLAVFAVFCIAALLWLG
jgi:hypothetical protein